jgi:hypothetical protein
MTENGDVQIEVAHHDAVSVVNLNETSYRHEVLGAASGCQVADAIDQALNVDVANVMPKFLMDLRASAEIYYSARQNFAVRARKHLVEISRIVLNQLFRLDEFAAQTGQKITKLDRQNEFRLPLRWAHLDGDPKVISNLSLVLNYVAGLANNDPDQVEAYFIHKSIKQALREYRASRKKTRDDISPKGNEQPMKLIGAPPDLSGIVTIQIEIIDGTARFIMLVEE